MKTKLLIILLLIISNVLSANTSSKNVNLQLSWLHQFQFAGYYVAKEKGFYNKAGLNVNINEFNFDINLQNVLKDNKAQFVVGKTSFIIDKISGNEIVALAAIFQHSPMMLLVRKDSKIKKAADLRGKNVMITNDAKNTAAILAMLSSQKISLDDVNVQPHSFDLNDLISGKTDAMASYVSNEPVRMKNKNIEHVIIHPKDYGFDFYNGMVFTTQNMINKDPDTVKAFHDATIKGWEYAFKNIEETSKIIFNKYNTQKKTLNDFIVEGEILKSLAYDKSGKIGSIDGQRVREIANVFLVMGLINKDYSLDNFIYEHNSPSANKIYLNKKEKNWIKNHPEITFSASEWEPINVFTDDKHTGMAKDILNEINKSLNLNIKFEKKSDFGSILDSIRNKTVDVLISTGITEDRKKYGLFTNPYMTFPLVIATKNDVSYISNTDELSGKVVAVGKNYTAYEYLKKNYPKIKLLVVKNSSEALDAVSSGKAYAMVDALPVVAHKIRKLNFTDLKISGEVEYSFKIRAFIRNDYPELVSVFNKAINNISEAKINEIISKWYSIEYVNKVDYFLVIEVILFFTVLILLIIFIQNNRLKKYNNKLQITLKDLNDTRDDLISSEKMATLGELVGGVTHEIISPLSVGIMGGSYIVELTNDIKILYENNNMSEDDFNNYIKNVSDTSSSITLNLNRTKILVNSFKEVAVDQAIEDKRDFNIKSYMDEIILSLDSKLKKTKVIVNIHCYEKLVVKSYPGYIAQIIFNLINNSLLHGFDQDQKGEINISFKEVGFDLEMVYTDNGKGISIINQDKIFEQYYTTKKGNGGTGIGLHIVKSIITSKLNGTVNLKSEETKGVEITVIIPL
jgi:polar amino acid transport system substrate-binding protein